MSGSLIVRSLGEKIQKYRESQFTGLIRISDQATHQWFIYYLLGQIVWTKSRTHSLRRWQRQLSVHSPTFFEEVVQSASPAYERWNYIALERLVKRQQFPKDEFLKIVEGCIIEDLFDILQMGSLQLQKTSASLVYEAFPTEAASSPFLMTHGQSAWQEARQQWQIWERVGFTKFSPDWAPVILQRDALKLQTRPQTFQTLTTFVNGKNTLRDLAIKLNEPVVPLTASILPYVSHQLLGLVEVPDIVEDASDGLHPELFKPNSFANRKTPHLSTLKLQTERAQKKPIISNPNSLPAHHDGNHRDKLSRAARNRSSRVIYIDDSPADSRAMSNIVMSLGYQYTNIRDPLQALPMLIELKPELIFLDLVMPIANGYEVCAQIRRISTFKDIPVIIVTSNDSIADRVRARIVGASGFLGKPIQREKVLKVLKKHLHYVECDHQSSCNSISHQDSPSAQHPDAYPLF
ncbi:MAG: response regulator [Phormidesmis sp.]